MGSDRLVWGALLVCLLAEYGVSVSAGSTALNMQQQQQNSLPLKYEAPDDCQWWLRESSYVNDEEVALACTLRTINSEFDTTNFSIIPSEHTTSLKVECSSNVMSRSSLSERSLSHLTRLRELIVDHCKLTKWPSATLAGLKDLRNLTVRTHNVDWPSMSLDLGDNCFRHVRQLERLDLSTNNIWQFAPTIFCSLANLVTLNISENRLQDIGDLYFRGEQRLELGSEEEAEDEAAGTGVDGCNLNIRVLDASYNHFVIAPNHGFSGLKQLQDLRLHNNEISMVADKALAGLKSLRTLDLSSNRIVSLPLGLFSECAESVKEIYLQNNSLSVISPGVFANLNQLLSLELSANQLTSAWMTNETFSGLIRLVLLNLSHNQIAKLEPTLFHDLYTLQILNLEQNGLESIAANTFAALNNLHTLVLSRNRLKHLEAYSLNGLYALSLLSLDFNRLESIHANAFRNCTGLQDLNLSGNKFTKVPPALKDMRLLKTLDLGENLISTIENPGFKGMTNLYGLRLIANQISVLGQDAFAELPSLQIINLSQNQLRKIEKGTFGENSKLEAVRVDSNYLSAVDEAFQEVASLVWLNMSDNKLRQLDYSALPPNLMWLDVHSNMIEEMVVSGGAGAVAAAAKSTIQTLDASFNRLTKLTAVSVPDSVELLFVNDNRITYIEPHTFVNKCNLTRADLYANNIERLELAALQITALPPEKSRPEFYIGGNPFQCDCTMEWLQRVNRLEMRQQQYPLIMDIDSIYCKLVFDREREFVPLVKANPSQFLCPYRTHCYTLCQCCMFDACDCEMNCPTNCSCYHDQSWTANIVDCSRASYAQMPNKMPMDATQVYLDGNRLPHLSSYSFIGRKNLRHLYANNSNIETISNYTFSGIAKLVSLHLQDNKLSALVGNEFSGLESLKELYLQNNLISAVHGDTFAKLKSLEVLRLDRNRLATLQVWRFVSNPYLINVAVSGNPWSCDCHFLNELRVWVQQNLAKIPDLDSVSCGAANNDTTQLVTFLRSPANATSSCLAFFGSFAENQILRDYLPFLLLASTVLIVLLIVAITVFLYKKELHLCLYTRCGLHSCYKSASFGGGGGGGQGQGATSADHDRLFDAYITYCVKDEDFITQILCVGMEQCDPPYRLCLHYRDFNVNSYITDTIIEAAESSKRTVIVLSKNFLQTEWCRFEYKSALREVLRDRKNKVAFVVLGEIATRELDSDLRLYLKISTCLQWGENLFWQKLKCFMPDVSKDSGTSSSFVISARNAANIYATPFNYYDNATSDIHRNNQRSAANYPPIPPPPQPVHPLPKICNQYSNSLARNGAAHIPAADKNVNLQQLWT